MINISNPTSKNNSSALLEAPTGLDHPTAVSVIVGAGSRRPEPGVLRRLADGIRFVLSLLAAVPVRTGDRLFAVNDNEAYWHDWQTTRTSGGLGRSYRDPRFDRLAECPKCHGAGGTVKAPCPPCDSTGRITRAEV